MPGFGHIVQVSSGDILLFDNHLSSAFFFGHIEMCLLAPVFARETEPEVVWSAPSDQQKQTTAIMQFGKVLTVVKTQSNGLGSGGLLKHVRQWSLTCENLDKSYFLI